jgi:NADH-quinone oxidoreductase subunit G
VSPHATLEELHLSVKLMKGLGSNNIDHRMRQSEFAVYEGVRYLGTTIAALSELQSVLVIGSSLRKEHPLFAQRIRQSARKGCVVSAISSGQDDWAMPVAHTVQLPAGQWVQALASVAAAVAAEKGMAPPVAAATNDTSTAIARALLTGQRKAILLGNGAAHHAQASSLLALAQWLADQTGASFGYLTEAANTVGAQLVGAQPTVDGLHARQMLGGALKAVVLLNTEPEFDSAIGAQAAEVLGKAQMVVSLNSFKANMAFCDVMLPISPFTETSGTFVNAEGLAQSFYAVVQPRGETRPAWKVLRVLGSMLKLPGFDFNSSEEVLQGIPGLSTGDVLRVSADRLDNRTMASINPNGEASAPVVAGIYQLDGIVRRAPALQQTADARAARTQEVAA